VSRRRESEYLLRRRVARKPDYVRYIEAEKNLENLRSLRNKKALARKAAKEREERKSSNDEKPIKPKSNSSVGDASIVQHIHLIYVRATRKFKDDLSFHLQHAEFAKEKKSYTMLSKIYAEALQIHPRNSGLWIEAASHEYFGYITNSKNAGMSGGGSIKSARVLLQRGLRVNQTSQELWLQSFCLELHYIQKLRSRREILQLGLKRPKIVDIDDSDEEASPIESFYEDAKLPRIIYKNAIKSVPSDILFRVKFIEQCKLFPQTQIVVDEIMTSIEEDFGEVEEAWIARARFAVENDGEESERTGFLVSSQPEQDDDSQKKRKHNEIEKSKTVRDDALQILNEATDSIQSPKMFMEAISFAKSYIGHLCSNADGEDLSPTTKRQIMDVGSFLKNIVRKVGDNDIISPELAVECTTVLIELGSPINALEYIETATTENDHCRASAQCWLTYAETKARVSGNPSLACQILREALKVIPLHDKGHKHLLSKLFLNLLALSSTAESTSRDKELSSLYDKLLLISHQKEEFVGAISLPSLSLAYMKYVSSKGNADLARKIYNKILVSSNYTKTLNKSDEEVVDMRTFFDQCIVVEKVASKYGGMDAKLQRRQLIRLYDAAFQFFNENGYHGIADTFTRMKNKELPAR